MPRDLAADRKLTKADLVERVHDEIGFSKKEAAEVVDSVFELMKCALERGEKVKIAGFGNFVVRFKRARRGRNPQTDEEIEISQRRVLVFKSSPVLRALLNPDAGTGDG